MATSLNLGFDPVVLSDVVERKGTLFLRSDHMKYGRATLNTDWSAIIIIIILQTLFKSNNNNNNNNIRISNRFRYAYKNCNNSSLYE